ncbi:FtsQ-type POTRA domain-containing protein [Streptomyces sp. NPDC005805]|uniref:cell division protein FtsQ/DivIB n=1 Tax=Streptomyces sp. NPDC005805 TaxID=3157068 RepID=UPI0033E343D9
MAGPTTAERGARPPRGESGSDGSDGSGGPVGPPRPGGGDRRRLVRRVLAAAVATALLAAGGTWVLYGSDWLRTEDVRVSGTGVLAPGAVERAARVPLGAPLASVDTDAVAARLRTALPRIRSVEVDRSWPHRIDLRVTERTPVLLLKKGPRFGEVDADGVQFATVDRAPRGVPLLELDATASPSRGRFGADRLLTEAVTVRGDLPEAALKALTVLQVRSYDDISLRLSGDRTVLWGSSEDGAAKARTLTALLKASPKARHFDVSAPTAPATTGG